MTRPLARAPRRSHLLAALIALSWAALPGCVSVDDFVDLDQDASKPQSDHGDPTIPDPTDPDADALPTPPDAAPAGFLLTAVEPTTGATQGGTEVMLSGSGFSEGLQVLFAESHALDVFVLNDRVAMVRTPPHPAGVVDVTVYHPDVEGGAPRALDAAYTFQSPLTIAAITPDEGHARGGEAFTLTGAGFTPDTLVYIGGRRAIDVQVHDDGTVTGVTPQSLGGTPGRVHVHARSPWATAEARRAYHYRVAPTLTALSPPVGPAEGGTVVRLEGAGLTDDTLVTFGAAEATVVARAKDGRWVEVRAPAGAAGDIVDVSATNGWGQGRLDNGWVYSDPAQDPYLLSCATLAPSSGASAGGDQVALACTGLHYGVEVRFGPAVAEVVATHAEAGWLEVVAPAGAPGTADVTVTSPFDEVVVGQPWTWLAPSPVSVATVTPGAGPVGGGTELVVKGAGFGPGAKVFVGGVPATQVVVEGPGQLAARTPPGSPGGADVRVVVGPDEGTLGNAFQYLTGALSLDLVTPPMAAQAGGTWLRVYGSDFPHDARVFVGDVEAPLIARVSSAELHVRSPRLEVGTWDARVVGATGEATLPAALSVYDPRSGYGGTWGEPIDETLNVTVRGTSGYGPVAGATVVVARKGEPPLVATTDDAGQVTFSQPGLEGPVDVTASHPEMDVYSVVHYDAVNVTIFLRPLVTPPPTGGGGGITNPLPEATLRGQVIGLGKYVVAPPGSCDAAAIADSAHCAACLPALGCETPEGQAEFACVDLAEQGHRCLQACSVPQDCPGGYVCGGSAGGTRCLPSPGEKIARCFVAPQSVFATDGYTPPTGWVGPGQTYELPSGRLGELAIVCFGGYRDQLGLFTPTVLGVRRHVFAASGAIMEDLDVTLQYPLKRTFRLRLDDPPTWPGGMMNPSVTISLDMGSDGVIPFTRPLVDGGDGLWLAPRQLAALGGELHDASYFLYTTLSAATPMQLPRTHNLIQDVRGIVQERVPVLTDAGWQLEPTQLQADLHGIWGASSDQVFAVGQGGTILLWSGASWTPQTSPTHQTLRALAGRAAEDLWAVGDAGAVVHFDGQAWQLVEAPLDAYRAVGTAPGQPVYAAGQIRLRRWDGAAWTVEGPAWLQSLRGVSVAPDGRIAAVGGGGRLFHRDAAGAWQPVETKVTQDLNAVWLDPQADALIAVGDDGVVLVGSVAQGVTAVETGATRDLRALAVRPDGRALAVGEGGQVLRYEDGAWTAEELAGWRSHALGVFAPADGGAARVVGEAAFVLGPILHFPVLTSPLHGGSASGDLTLGWKWSGPDANYSQLSLREETGALLWTLIVDGPTGAAPLPDLGLLAGHKGVGQGPKRIEILRVLNRDFDIDEHSTRDFNLFLRDSWALDQFTFYAP